MTQKSKYEGLTLKQIEESRSKYGDNIITPAKRASMWRLFFEKFNDPIIKILLVAAAISFIISLSEGGFAETLGIIFAIILATGISFYFERDAGKKFEALTRVNDDIPVRAIRQGEVVEVPRRDLVVGDIVMIETGDEIPADGILLESVSLQVDESTLTGELMIEKTTDPEAFDKEATYPSNMVMRGTNVLDGHAVMQIEKVGDSTQYGQVAEHATKNVEEETPLNKQLSSLAGLISGIAVVLGIITFFVMTVKELRSASAISILPQQKTILASMLALLLTLMGRIFLPAISTTLSVFKIKTDKMNKLASRSWGFFITTSIVVGIAVYAISSLFTGFFSPLDKSVWLDTVILKHIVEAFMVAVTLIVVVVPEGLPMSITLSLALNMRRMLKTNNLVRKIHASETMGAVTVICTDKTGTLTQNKMHVEAVRIPSLPAGLSDNDEMSRIFTEGIAANTTAQLGRDVNGKISALGNPTEGALLMYLDENGIDYRPIREKARVLKQLTFSTQRKYMATLVVSAVTGKKVLYAKGAPEILAGMSKTMQTPEGVKPITAADKENLVKGLTEYQSKAMRTLAFAYAYVEDKNDSAIEDIVKEGLTFIGFAAISDPVRPDVPAAVKRCLNAGINIKIVTGDTMATAREIGRQIGIISKDEQEKAIIGGSEFAALSDEEAAERVKELKIMCRARPTDKQRLVELLQQQGEVVAVTGDGTNDAPALNQAHVGLSMGSGTSVAKEASDITLLDDSFSSIATAVMWGRSLYRNIQRFLLFQLTINIVALVVVFVGVFFTATPPLTVMQMLWVNIIMDTFAAMAFASIRPEANVMNYPPRKNSDFIINKSMFKQLMTTSLLFVAVLMGLLGYFVGTSTDTPYNMTLFFTVFVMLQLVNMFIVRGYAAERIAGESIKEMFPKTFMSVAVMILAGQFLIVQFGGEVFRTVPLTVETWCWVLVVAIAVIAIDVLIKMRKKRQ